jgi:KDO2-lipid IV(A) lauroyltransferase
VDDRLPLWRRLRRRVWYAVLVGVLGTVRALPDAVGRRWCRQLAGVGLRTRTRERRRAHRNLAWVYPERPDGWYEAFLTRTAAALGETLHATLMADRLAARGFPDVVEAPGPDGQGLLAVLRTALAEGRGALVITGHLGCWELLGAWLAANLDGAAVVTGTVRNPAVDRLLQERRRRLGLEMLRREEGAGPVLRALERGAAVGVLIDQNTGASSAPVPFLGRAAPTPLGPARLARRRGSPLVVAALVRDGGRWVAHHAGRMDPADAADDVALTARLNDALGQFVERNPEQWVWFHDRWDLEASHP